MKKFYIYIYYRDFVKKIFDKKIHNSDIYFDFIYIICIIN